MCSYEWFFFFLSFFNDVAVAVRLLGARFVLTSVCSIRIEHDGERERERFLYKSNGFRFIRFHKLKICVLMLVREISPITVSFSNDGDDDDDVFFFGCCCCYCHFLRSLLCVWHKRRTKVIYYCKKKQQQLKKISVVVVVVYVFRVKKNTHTERVRRAKWRILEQIVAKTKLNSCWLNLENIFRQRALAFFYCSSPAVLQTSLTYTHTVVQHQYERKNKNKIEKEEESEWFVYRLRRFCFDS